jgi:uncharacterized protein YaiL (DUF2058 family)
MSNSLRDQLLGLGYKPAPAPERPVERKSERSPERKADHSSDRKPDRLQGRKPERTSERRPDRSSERTPNRSSDRRPDGSQASGADARPRPAPARTDPRARRAPNSPNAKPRTQEEIDLGKAYALRAQKEKEDRIEAERLKQEEAKKRREAKAQLAVLLKDKALNDRAAEIARHFEYGGKIKRIHVTPEQLSALNAGELGVAQMDGRYLLIPVALLLEAEAIFPQAVALKVDPNAAPSDDPYSDPAYQVPDDLVW